MYPHKQFRWRLFRQAPKTWFQAGSQEVIQEFSTDTYGRKCANPNLSATLVVYAFSVLSVGLAEISQSLVDQCTVIGPAPPQDSKVRLQIHGTESQQNYMRLPRAADYDVQVLGTTAIHPGLERLEAARCFIYVLT